MSIIDRMPVTIAGPEYEGQEETLQGVAPNLGTVAIGAYIDQVEAFVNDPANHDAVVGSEPNTSPTATLDDIELLDTGVQAEAEKQEDDVNPADITIDGIAKISYYNELTKKVPIPVLDPTPLRMVR